MNILITGGCGFIGTNFIKVLLSKSEHQILNIDKLTYASFGNNLNFIKKNDKYSFIQGDICNKELIYNCFSEFQPDYIFNFAAESHVDNSIHNSHEFIQTNIFGTYNLLEQSRNYYNSLSNVKRNNFKFHQVSTDEVYGDMKSQLFHEKSPYQPSSPYSASKASADHLVRAWHRTYNLPTVITNCSNNFGPYQYPEKLIPVVIINALSEKRIPVYGDGKQIRDWIFVDDHNEALMQCLNHAKSGETYNIGSSNQINNIDLIKTICAQLDILKPLSSNRKYFALIDYIKDRPGHDRQYGINNQKAVRDLSWQPKTNFQDSIQYTIQWYIDHQEWWKKIIDKKND